MARKRYKPEEIVAKLRQVDVLVSQGQAVADAIRQIGFHSITPSAPAQSYFICTLIACIFRYRSW
jgi:putative transposase